LVYNGLTAKRKQRRWAMSVEVKIIWFSKEETEKAETELAERLSEGWECIGTSAAWPTKGSSGKGTVDAYIILRRDAGGGGNIRVGKISIKRDDPGSEQPRS